MRAVSSPSPELRQALDDWGGSWRSANGVIELWVNGVLTELSIKCPLELLPKALERAESAAKEPQGPICPHCGGALGG